MIKKIKSDLASLFQQWAGEKVTKIEELPPSGSNRRYFRIQGRAKNAVGTFNDDRKENIAFLTFAKKFYEHGLSVPEIYCSDLDKNIYLQSDCGDETLFAFLSKNRNESRLADKTIELYKKVICELPKFQILAFENFDFSVSYPRAVFDKQSMMWDLNYFKYYFLKLAEIPFDEQELEDDFNAFADYLQTAKHDYFLYRDFQSRNIMVKDNAVFFIDFQGGRRGALQYDLASLLYDGKADLPQETRNMLLDFYIEQVRKYIPLDVKEFKAYYHAYVLLRIMQAMGAYGFRGFYQKKKHFLQSIPFALKNIEYLIDNVEFSVEIPVLKDLLKKLTKSERLQKIGASHNRLLLTISSFSYKKGIPSDNTGNGGGFVFDCRALANPGRYEQYKTSTGKDNDVIEFFSKKQDIRQFVETTTDLVSRSVEKYLERKFTHLFVAYGCTGGQHRSVYCAEALAQNLKKKYDVDVVLRHREQKLKKTFQND